MGTTATNSKPSVGLSILVVTEWYTGFRWHVPQLPQNLSKGNIDVINIPFQTWPKDCFSTIKHIKKIVKKIHEYNVVILRGNTISTLIIMLLKYFNLVQSFVVIAEFNTSEKNRSIRSIVKYFIYSKILSKCDLIFPFSDVHSQYYQEKLKLDEKKLFTIPEAVNYLSVPEYPNVITNCDNYILAVGRTGRDYVTFYEAIKKRNDKIVVVANKKSVEGVDFSENVKLLIDIPLDELLSLVSRAKYIVLPLKHSIHPVGLRMLFYAMERGKACIVTRTLTISEYFTPDGPLITVPPGDPNALMCAMESLDSNPDEINNRGKLSRQLVERKFTSRDYIVNAYKAICENYKKTYNEISAPVVQDQHIT